MTDMTLPTPAATSVHDPNRADRVTLPALPDKLSEPSPQDRLAASRMQLRSALMEIAHPPHKAAGAGLGGKLAGAMQGVPGLSILLDTVKGWWKDHGAAVRNAGRASQAVLQPMAKRYPTGVVGAAVAGGVVLMLLRPWRWLLRPKFLFAVASLVATQAIKGRSAGAWLQTALRLVGSTKRSL